MANDARMLRAIIRSAQLKATALGGGATAQSVLEGILSARFDAEASNGVTVISTTEAGGSVTFQFPGSLSPGDVIMLANEAIEYMEKNVDANGHFKQPRRINRLRASFERLPPQ